MMLLKLKIGIYRHQEKCLCVSHKIFEFNVWGFEGNKHIHINHGTIEKTNT